MTNFNYIFEVGHDDAVEGYREKISHLRQALEAETSKCLKKEEQMKKVNKKKTMLIDPISP